MVLEGGNAGLGAGRGREQTETYGLSGFQGILGRLNGKSDREVKKEAITQRDIQLRLYTGQRYGFLNFVSGGLLVGDTIRPKERKGENGFSTGTQIRTTEQPPKLASAVSQRKHRSEEAANPARMEKRSKKSQKAEEAIPDSDGENSGKEEEAKRVRKKERRQKRAEKEARRRRRQERRLEKQGQRGAEASRDRQRSKSLSLPSDTVSLKTPKASIHRGQAVRRRYIHQKRLASSNTQALNEVSLLVLTLREYF